MTRKYSYRFDVPSGRYEVELLTTDSDGSGRMYGRRVKTFVMADDNGLCIEFEKLSIQGSLCGIKIRRK